MNPRLIVGASLLLAAVHGVATELFLRRGLLMPLGVTAVFIFAFCVLAFVWYVQDAKLRGWNRRFFVGVTVLLFPTLGLPLYAAVSRPPGNRVNAALGAFGFVLFLLFVSVLTGVLAQAAMSAV